MNNLRVSLFIACGVLLSLSYQAQALSCVPTAPRIGIVESVSAEGTNIQLRNVTSYDESTISKSGIASIDAYKDLVSTYLKSGYLLTPLEDYVFEPEILELSSEFKGYVDIHERDIIISGPHFHGCSYGFTGVFTPDGELKQFAVHDSFQSYSHLGQTLSVRSENTRCTSDTCKTGVTFKTSTETMSLFPVESTAFQSNAFPLITLVGSKYHEEYLWGINKYAQYVVHFPSGESVCGDGVCTQEEKIMYCVDPAPGSDTDSDEFGCFHVCEEDCKKELFCTKDVYECSDGSFVSRDSNNDCKFKPCPGEPVCGNHICEEGEKGGFTPYVCPQDCEEELRECRENEDDINEVFAQHRSCNRDTDCAIWDRDHFTPWACKPYNKQAEHKLLTLFKERNAALHCPTSDAGYVCEHLEVACEHSRCVANEKDSICGNNRCEPGETTESCSRDCAYVHCPVPTCESPPAGCFYESSSDLGEDGCPLYPCGVLACEERFCTADAYQCPDGRWIGRDPKRGCQFICDDNFEDEVRINKSIESDVFEDLFSTTDIRDAAETLRSLNIIGGFPDGTYREHEYLNRAQVAKFITNAMNVLAEEGFACPIQNQRNNGRFSDVLEGEWYVQFVIGAADCGVIKGNPNGTFAPQNSVNTVEFLAMLARAFDLELNLAHSYNDVPASAWYNQYASIAAKYQLFPDRTRNLEPAAALNRGEVAYAMARIIDALRN